jgi:hypothetical protein
VVEHLSGMSKDLSLSCSFTKANRQTKKIQQISLAAYMNIVSVPSTGILFIA